MNDNVLAVKIGPEQDYWNGTVDTGYRAVMAVTHIVGKVQTTVFYGNTLHLLWNSAGQLDPQHAFQFFCDQFVGRPPMVWGQLSEPPPNPLAMTRRIYLIPTPTPEPPIAEAPMIILASGYDPMQGFWVEFQGNYWLHIPLFRDFQCVQRYF